MNELSPNLTNKSAGIQVKRGEPENKFGSLRAEPTNKPRPEPQGLVRILREKVEPWFLEQKEIGAHMGALEQDVSQEWMRLRLRYRTEFRSAGRINATRGGSSALLWYALAVTIGCFGWLSYIIYEALR